MTKRFRWLSALLAMAMLVTSVAPVLAQEEPVDEPAEGEQVERVYMPLVSASEGSRTFKELSRDLTEMEYLFSGGNTEGSTNDFVEFDVEGALEAGFHPDSVALAEEMAAHTNFLIERSLEQGSVVAADVDSMNEAENYPLVDSFFSSAGEARENTEDEVQAAVDLCDLNAGCACGNWEHPKPSVAAGRVHYHGLSNPEQFLRNRGYHETRPYASNYSDGDWTRPETYRSFQCGWNTYRDHGRIDDNDPRVNEQIYTISEHGLPGEPNPEIHNSGPWPYITWPSYVHWWHTNPAAPGG